MFWITAIGIVLAAITGVIFYGQFREMISQTDMLDISARQARRDSADSSIATQKQIAIAQQQAASAQASVRLAAKESAQNAVRIEKQLQLLQSQADAARAQADAALRSAIAIQEQTEISERPWISVEATAPNGLTFVNGEQPAFALRLSIKNVGKSIAKDVQADAKLFPTSPSFPVSLDALKHQGELCDHPASDPIGRFDLFPGETTDREMDVSVNPNDIASQSVTYPGDKPRKFVGFYAVGCVSYRFSFGTKFHQTRFAYHLLGPIVTSPDGKLFIPPNGMMPPMMGFEVGVNVPKDKVNLMQELFGRSDSN